MYNKITASVVNSRQQTTWLKNEKVFKQKTLMKSTNHPFVLHSCKETVQ